ncbi:hypothetical protein SAMN06265348_107285 [Pedobacter westerhofensis]|uniref:Uncharacterized protein n=1 Tax=Pedobacter westerhofensis TaxID=425512 RepID=A0A521EAE1_9SPHI|nr:hypothetical protein SAMN06265348_107285 [Pedobacter westerhofensis]
MLKNRFYSCKEYIELSTLLLNNKKLFIIDE